jgi:hypothetical protein
MVFLGGDWPPGFTQAKQTSHLAPRDEQKAFVRMADDDFS